MNGGKRKEKKKRKKKNQLQRSCINSTCFFALSAPNPIGKRTLIIVTRSLLHALEWRIIPRHAQWREAKDWRQNGGLGREGDTRVFTSAEMITFLSSLWRFCILTNCNIIFMNCLTRTRDTARHYSFSTAHASTWERGGGHFRGTWSGYCACTCACVGR